MPLCRNDSHSGSHANSKLFSRFGLGSTFDRDRADAGRSGERWSRHDWSIGHGTAIYTIKGRVRFRNERDVVPAGIRTGPNPQN